MRPEFKLRSNMRIARNLVSVLDSSDITIFSINEGKQQTTKLRLKLSSNCARQVTRGSPGKEPLLQVVALLKKRPWSLSATAFRRFLWNFILIEGGLKYELEKWLILAVSIVRVLGKGALVLKRRERTKKKIE